MPSTAASPLRVSRSDDGRVVRLMLSGELDISTATCLELELKTVEARRPAVLVLDLENLRFMGVSGLRSILDAARRARREGRQLVVTNPVPHILRLFELTAIDQSVELLRAPLTLVPDGMPDPRLATADDFRH
jgi:anti-anti-sigma factor